MSRAMRRHPMAGKPPKGGGPPKGLPRSAAAKPKRKTPFWQPRWIMDIVGELRRVVWPTRHDTIRLTVVVVIIAGLIGAALGGVDLGFAWIVENILIP